MTSATRKRPGRAADSAPASLILRRRRIWCVVTIPIETLDALDFLVPELQEFVCTSALGEHSAVLMQEPVQQIQRACGHVHNLLHTAHEAIVTFQVGDFLGQVVLDRGFDAVIQEFRVRGGIEISVIVCGVVDHLDAFLL